jgi:hypothetical protein
VQNHAEFNNLIEQIIQYEYKLLPQEKLGNQEKQLLEQLLLRSKQICKRYTGPHSVLQIFLEKIIDCIGKIQKQIKEMTQQQLYLWTEETCTIKQKAPQQPKSLQRSSSADSKLLIVTSKVSTSSQNNNNNSSNFSN